MCSGDTQLEYRPADSCSDFPQSLQAQIFALSRQLYSPSISFLRLFKIGQSVKLDNHICIKEFYLFTYSLMIDLMPLSVARILPRRIGRAQAVSHRFPTAPARVRARGEHVGFVVDKVALGQVFSECFGFPANHHSTKFSIIIMTRGWHNRLICGRNAEWTQLDSTPRYSN
jgi:hypothetical protein